jgi:hypothetical protein
MTTMLGDGTVFPSFMTVTTPNPTPTGLYGMDSLYEGVVQSITYPDSDKSRSKKYVEYSVEVHLLVDGARTKLLKEHVIWVNTFGSVPDKLFWTYRYDDKDDKVKLGARVLIAFIQGESAYPVIVAGLPSLQEDQKNKIGKDLGHHLSFSFNGLEIGIDQNGQFSLTRTGPTKKDGSHEDSVSDDNAGQTLVFNKDGGVEIKSIQDCKLTVGATCEIDVQKKVTIKSGGLEVGAADERMVLGTTYRKEEHSLNDTIRGCFQDLIQQISILNASITAAATSLKTGTLPGVAVAGGALQPCTNALSQMAQTCAKAVQAYATFEAKAETYLSTENKLSDKGR